MLARFWGTRGSIAAPGPATIRFGGNTSCVELTTPSGRAMVLDCGTGARPLGNRLMARANGPISATILLSHTHWDHIQGFPFFGPLFKPENCFKVYGPEGAHHSLRDVLAGQMEHHYFPVDLNQLSAHIDFENLQEGAYQIDGLSVRTQSMNHPSPTLGYRIEDGGRSICYLCDHEPYCEDIWREGAEAFRFESILEEGDRRHAEFMQGADVVIHEAQYTPDEYPSKRHWGHSTYPYAVGLAALSGVGRLFLTHHDPSHDDEFIAGIERKARELARRLGSPLEVSCAYEGCEFTV